VKHRKAVVGVALAVALLTAACGSNGSGSGSGASKADIHIASIDPLTGAAAVQGGHLLEGAQAAAYVVNHNGGIMGHKVVIDAVNTGGDPVDAVPALRQEIAKNHPIACVGQDSLTFSATSPICQQNQLPMLATSGDPSLDNLDIPSLWRMAPSDSDYGPAIAQALKILGYTKVSELLPAADPQQVWGPLFVKAFDYVGGTANPPIYYTTGQSSYNSEVLKAINQHPQVIIFEDPSISDAVAITSEMKSINNLAIPLLGDDNSTGQDWIKGVGPSLIVGHMKDVVPSSGTGPQDKAAVASLTSAVTALKIKGGVTPAQFGQFDAVIELALALTSDGANTSETAIDNAIAQNSNPPGILVGSYAAAVKDLAAKKQINYEGVGGPLDFDPTTHITHGPWEIVEPLVDTNTKALGTVPANLVQCARLENCTS
jgi:branched-chain amino acid transport system substrate-binding protein